MSGGNRGDRICCWRVIEQGIAAAVDLEVDKAGGEPDSIRERSHRQSFCLTSPDEPRDPISLDQDRRTPVKSRSVKNVVRRDCMPWRRRHSVDVTFCRCLG